MFTWEPTISAILPNLVTLLSGNLCKDLCKYFTSYLLFLTLFSATEKFVHPYYDSSYAQFDLSLIKLPAHVTLTSKYYFKI